jgi:hypothetical protein
MLALAPVNRGFLKKSRFSIGCVLRRSHTKNVTSSTAAMPSAPRIFVSLQPSVGASMNA